MKFFYSSLIKNSQKQLKVLIMFVSIIFIFIAYVIDIQSAFLTISIFLFVALAISILENKLNAYLNKHFYILLGVCWGFFLFYRKMYLSLTVYLLVACFLAAAHFGQSYFKKTQKISDIENITMVQTIFLDFGIIERHLREDFPIFLLLRKAYVVTFLINIIIVTFLPTLYNDPRILKIGGGFLLLWWFIMWFLFFLRYQIISFCNVVINLPFVQKAILVAGASTIGTTTVFLGFHVSTTTPGITPPSTPFTGLYQDYVLGYRSKTSSQLIYGEAHSIAYPGERVPVDANNYVDCKGVQSKLSVSTSQLLNSANSNLPYFLESKEITSDLFFKKKE